MGSMGRKGKKKPPDRQNRAPKIVRAANEPGLRGDGPDCRPTGTGLSGSPLRRCSAAAVCALLLLAVALVFGQTVRHEFIDYDDHDYVGDNPQVARGFTASGIAWAFTRFHSSNWHPLTWLSHMLDCQLYGLNYPGGHHLTNVLLHAASAALVFLVLRQITGDLWPSAFAAALFAIHPLHVESVAWVAERKDVLSGLFFMLTLAAYADYARRPFSLPRYLLVTVLFVLGLMAKPMLVTLPFVLLLLDYWPLGRISCRGAFGAGKSSSPGALREPLQNSDDRRQAFDSVRNPPFSRQSVSPTPQSPALGRGVLEKLPWLVLTAVSCAVTYAAQGTAGSICQRLPLGPRIANALVSCATYLIQFFHPVRLAVFYPYPQDSLPIGKIAGSGLLLAGISLAVLACRRKCPYLLVGWLWYLGMLVPVIGLVQVGSQSMADRYSYLPQIGLYIALAWGAERASRDWACRRWVGGAAATIVLASLACRAWQQASYWKNEETLWTHALACTAENYLARNGLGTVAAERGQIDEAVAQYRRAVKLEPNYELAHYNLGLVLAGREQVEEAIAQFQKALEIKPDHVAALNNLAWILATYPDARFRDGRRAVTLAQRARELSSSDANTLDTLAAACAEAGRFGEAVQTAHRALDLATQQDDRGLAESIRAKLRLYEAGMPFHKSPSLPASIRP